MNALLHGGVSNRQEAVKLIYGERHHSGVCRCLVVLCVSPHWCLDALSGTDSTLKVKPVSRFYSEKPECFYFVEQKADVLCVCWSSSWAAVHQQVRETARAQRKRRGAKARGWKVRRCQGRRCQGVPLLSERRTAEGSRPAEEEVRYFPEKQSVICFHLLALMIDHASVNRRAEQSHRSWIKRRAQI